MFRRKNIELWASIFWNIPALLLSLTYGTNYVFTMAIFALPALYYSWHKPKAVHKVALFSILFIIPATAILTYFTHRDGSWFNPSLFPRIFDVYPIEDYVWSFLYTYWIIATYEYFFEHERKFVFPRRFRPIIIFLLLIACAFSLLVYLYPHIPTIPYFYAYVVSLLIILIPWMFLAWHQELIPKSVKTALFFLLPSLLIEYVAYVNHNWWFPGNHFVGYLQSFGITIPLEEFLWILFAVPAWIVYYELLADDGR